MQAQLALVVVARRQSSQLCKSSRYSQTEREMLAVVVEQSLAEDYVNFVCNNAVPKAMTLEEISKQPKKM